MTGKTIGKRKRSSAKKKEKKPDLVEDVRIGESPVPGATLRCILHGHSGYVGSIAWSPPDGKYLASPSNDGTIRIWDIEREKSFAVLTEDKERVSWIAWSPDGQRLAYTSDDGKISIWDIEKEKSRVVIKGNFGVLVLHGRLTDKCLQ